MLPELDAALNTRLAELCSAGWDIFERFDTEVRDKRFHPFVAAEYEKVLAALIEHRREGQRFLEWGSASGVITIMADLLGYEACGIELDDSLVQTARELAARFNSNARFVAGSFVPAGYAFSPKDTESAWIGDGPGGYLALGRGLDDFDVVFGFPWPGGDGMMLDLMRRYGGADALLLMFSVDDGVTAYHGAKAFKSPLKRTSQR
jgi:hypothetical protein